MTGDVELREPQRKSIQSNSPREITGVGISRSNTPTSFNNFFFLFLLEMINFLKVRHVNVTGDVERMNLWGHTESIVLQINH